LEFDLEINEKLKGRDFMYKVMKRFIQEESAIGVVELILILVVLIGLVIIFRDQLTSLLNGIFERIVSDSAAV